MQMLRRLLSTLKPEEQTHFNHLRQLNFLAAGIHSALIFLLLTISSHVVVPTTMVYSQYSANIPLAETKVMFTVDILSIVVGYLAIAALAHLLAATLLRERYQRYLSEHRNPLRWLEYSLSCSLMLVATALAGGVTQLNVLVSIFSLAFCMNLCGLVFEGVNRQDGSKL